MSVLFCPLKEHFSDLFSLSSLLVYNLILPIEVGSVAGLDDLLTGLVLTDQPSTTADSEAVEKGEEQPATADTAAREAEPAPSKAPADLEAVENQSAVADSPAEVRDTPAHTQVELESLQKEVVEESLTSAADSELEAATNLPDKSECVHADGAAAIHSEPEESSQEITHTGNSLPTLDSLPAEAQEIANQEVIDSTEELQAAEEIIPVSTELNQTFNANPDSAKSAALNQTFDAPTEAIGSSAAGLDQTFDAETAPPAAALNQTFDTNTTTPELNQTFHAAPAEPQSATAPLDPTFELETASSEEPNSQLNATFDLASEPNNKLNSTFDCGNAAPDLNATFDKADLNKTVDITSATSEEDQTREDNSTLLLNKTFDSTSVISGEEENQTLIENQTVIAASAAADPTAASVEESQLSSTFDTTATVEPENSQLEEPENSQLGEPENSQLEEPENSQLEEPVTKTQTKVPEETPEVSPDLPYHTHRIKILNETYRFLLLWCS